MASSTQRYPMTFPIKPTLIFQLLSKVSSNAIEQEAFNDLISNLKEFHLQTPEAEVDQALQRYLDITKAFLEPDPFLIAGADHGDHVRGLKSTLEESEVDQALQRYLDITKAFCEPPSISIADADHGDHVRRVELALKESEVDQVLQIILDITNAFLKPASFAIVDAGYGDRFTRVKLALEESEVDQVVQIIWDIIMAFLKAPIFIADVDHGYHVEWVTYTLEEFEVGQALQRYFYFTDAFSEPASNSIADADHGDYVRRVKSALEELGTRYNTFRQTWDNSWGNPEGMLSVSHELRVFERCRYVHAVSSLCEIGVPLKKALEAICCVRLCNEYKAKAEGQLMILRYCLEDYQYIDALDLLRKAVSQSYSVSNDEMALFPGIPEHLPLSFEQLCQIVSDTRHCLFAKCETGAMIKRSERAQDNWNWNEGKRKLVASEARKHIDETLKELPSRLKYFDTVQATFEPLFLANSGIQDRFQPFSEQLLREKFD